MQSLSADLTHLAKQLTQMSQQLAVAESCTGGELSAAMTQLPGSSQWFDCGFVTYSNQAKQRLLGVRPHTLQRYGAVSEPVAIEMAQGALLHSPAHWAIAVTGIAGPAGGSPAKPVGTVWLAWTGSALPMVTHCAEFSGDRAAIRQQTVAYAVHRLLTWMSDIIS
ncbi:MAG: nicotinamide-nucleotide amidohydrolase family protein [Legionellales bacterium]|nr:nicotinamide-nucleotide amidohydrolase family protein [Legionellales bacterium]